MSLFSKINTEFREDGRGSQKSDGGSDKSSFPPNAPPGFEWSKAVYAGIRVKDTPTPPVKSETRECTGCGEDIWVDVRTLDYADKCPRRICMQCMKEEIDEKG